MIVRHLPVQAGLLWLLGIAAATLIWGWLMHRYTDAAFAWWDASVAMISVGAMMSLRSGLRS